MTIGQILRDQRLRMGLTLNEMRERLDLQSPQTVGNWERDYQLPPEERLETIFRVYEFPDDQIQLARKVWEAQHRSNRGPEKSVIDENEGESPMIIKMDGFRRRARIRTDQHHLIHSVSNDGYLTAKSSDLSDAVFRCAKDGVDVVYFPLPGKLSVTEVKQSLTQGFRKSFAQYNAMTAPDIGALNFTDIQPHIWLLRLKHGPLTVGDFITPPQQKYAKDFLKKHFRESTNEQLRALTDLLVCLSAPANLFGSHIAFLAFLTATKRDGDPARHLTADDLSVEDIWINVRDPHKMSGARWYAMAEKDGHHFTSQYRAQMNVLTERHLITAEQFSIEPEHSDP